MKRNLKGLTESIIPVAPNPALETWGMYVHEPEGAAEGTEEALFAVFWEKDGKRYEVHVPMRLVQLNS